MTTASMAGAEPVKALVVDDDLQLQAALRQMLSRAGLDVAGAGDKGEALSTAAASAPDVVVLDLSLPDGDGIEVLAELRTWSDVPVLVLTGATDPRRMLAAFEAGADDYLRKPFGPDELLARLRALLRRPRGGEEESAQRTYGPLEIDLAARTVSVAGERVHLTPTEWRILGALVANPGKLLTAPLDARRGLGRQPRGRDPGRAARPPAHPARQDRRRRQCPALHRHRERRRLPLDRGGG